MKYVLWTVQVVLALVFLFAGGSKLVMPAEVLTAQSPFPELFLRFIGVCEVLGAIGLILPGLLRIRQNLTRLAAAGLVVIMAGATVVTLAIGGGVMALMPFMFGLLAAFIVYGRTRFAPQVSREPSRSIVLEPAR